MEIKLTQSGGFADKKMEAIVNSKLSEKEWDALLKAVAKKPENDGKAKDAFSYTIQKNQEDKTKMAIDIQAIPEIHNDLFKKIFDELKPIR